MTKATLRKAKIIDLMRLAKWLLIGVIPIDHEELVEEIYWKIEFGKPNK